MKVLNLKPAHTSKYIILNLTSILGPSSNPIIRYMRYYYNKGYTLYDQNLSLLIFNDEEEYLNDEDSIVLQIKELIK